MRCLIQNTTFDISSILYKHDMAHFYLELLNPATALKELNLIKNNFIIKYQQYHRDLTNNAQLVRLKGNTILRATKVILATPSEPIEITVSYGCAYWITKAATH